MTEQEMLDRTKKFALRVLNLVAALPNTIAGRAIAGQIVRSGTSVASNYRAACRGRSKAEFIANWELQRKKQMKVVSGWK
ncbi:hypothetical protein BH20ACI2_BH20ACI2_21410 [soil metagenome]